MPATYGTAACPLCRAAAAYPCRTDSGKSLGFGINVHAARKSAVLEPELWARKVDLTENVDDALARIRAAKEATQFSEGETEQPC